jgi:hypothetical protein
MIQGLDEWKQIYDIKSRSEAIVTILEDYLDADYLIHDEVQQESPAPPRTRLSTLLDEINELRERVDALEEENSTALREVSSKALTNSHESDSSNVPLEVPSKALTDLHESGSSNVPLEVPSKALTDSHESGSSNVLNEAPSTALVEGTGLSDDAFNTAPGTAPNPLTPQPPNPLTQSALAKRLGCSDKAVEKHRKQGDKEDFAEWSRERDPDNLAWTWEGTGGRGQPLRFVPLANYLTPHQP